MPESYSIGEIAGLTGVSVETLRYYERRPSLETPASYGRRIPALRSRRRGARHIHQAGPIAWSVA